MSSRHAEQHKTSQGTQATQAKRVNNKLRTRRAQRPEYRTDATGSGLFPARYGTAVGAPVDQLGLREGTYSVSGHAKLS